MARPILLSTVGTSLFFPNLAGLRRTLADDSAKPDDKKAVKPALRPIAEQLAGAYEAKDWPAVARHLAELPATERLCGAEVNSVASLISNGYTEPNAGAFFFHSDTDDGRAIASVLVELFRLRGHAPCAAVCIPDLQDADPKRFRTKGLRNLAKLLAAKVREYGPAACALNCTGGYKAQVAVAVLMGQAVGVPVYYMHERFSEIIAFPPLPVAFDFELWTRASGLLAALEREPQPRTALDDDWDERYESLVEAETIDGVEFLELSATGQVFHDTFRERFRTARDQVLPPPALAKRPPKLADHAVINRLKAALSRHFLEVTAGVAQVVGCETTYCNPDLPQPTRFRLKGNEVEGIFSDGTATVKFRVDTTATTDGQRAAVVAALNEWVATRS
jgi:putative CRISPR-associated protein (TIGR02619 family)